MLLGSWVGEVERGWGSGKGNHHTGGLLMIQPQARGGGHVGREGAVASIKRAGEGWRAGSHRQHQQMVFTAGQEGGAGCPWA